MRTRKKPYRNGGRGKKSFPASRCSAHKRGAHILDMWRKEGMNYETPDKLAQVSPLDGNY